MINYAMNYKLHYECITKFRIFSYTTEYQNVPIYYKPQLFEKSKQLY